MTNQEKTTTRPIILIVDDESSTLAALERVLRNDFKVLKASDAEQGMVLLNQNPEVSVILSDYRLPKMSGTDFLIAAKQVAPNTICAILSGQVDLNDLMSAINQSAIHRLILKPWDNEYLRVQMLECLQQHSLLSEKNLLKQLSITDPVTGLTNHRFFQESLKIEFERAKRHNRPLGLIMVDVDHFKSFNDRYGHPLGDSLLAAISKILLSQVRGIDSVSRYGGEEFAIILPDTQLEQVIEVAHRLERSIKEKSFAGIEEQTINMTISLGVASYPDHADSTSKLIDMADQALYRAKRQGRNQTVIASNS